VRIAVTGSIAIDHLMSFPGRFRELIVEEQLDRLSLSFLVDDLEVRRGGVAANIAFGMAQLGLRPMLVGAVGHDFEDYGAWLERNGVDIRSVHVAEDVHTARFHCTTDLDQNQIASFYTGAMARAREIEMGPVEERAGGLDLVLVAPNDPEAMARHTDECRRRGTPFVADPSQQLARIGGEAIRRLVDGAAVLLTNDYERAILERKTGWSGDEVLERVEVRVTTHGADGSVVETRDGGRVEVAAVPDVAVQDPTGVGDAYRAGFLSARIWGSGHERAAQVGSVLAAHVLETVGTQEYVVEAGRFLDRLAATYGDDAAQDVAPHLPD
jgi:adenosine kinase